MFGNIMNNKQVFEATNEYRPSIEISEFDRSKLKTIHYPLTIGKMFNKGVETPEGGFRLDLIRDLTESSGVEYISLVDNQFIVVEVAEHISLRESIVGHVIPASIVARKGLSLMAGRIEAPFGKYNKAKQRLQFGLKNLSGGVVFLKADEIIAYVYFVDLRGLDKDAVILTDEEARKFALWSRRFARADSDGPSHATGDSRA